MIHWLSLRIPNPNHKWCPSSNHLLCRDYSLPLANNHFRFHCLGFQGGMKSQLSMISSHSSNVVPSSYRLDYEPSKYRFEILVLNWANKPRHPILAYPWTVEDWWTIAVPFGGRDVVKQPWLWGLTGWCIWGLLEPIIITNNNHNNHIYNHSDHPQP